MPHITVNGHPREVPPDTTVAELITLHNLTPDKVAVELNRRLVRTPAYDTVLKDNDEVELVTFVGGG
jgi:thiamine biosynthesis protein ThiS